MTPLFAVHSAFCLLAPSIRPSTLDVRYQLRMVEDLRGTCYGFRLNPDLLTCTLTEDEGIPCVHIMHESKPGIILSTAWIEFATSPDAFFYFES